MPSIVSRRNILPNGCLPVASGGAHADILLVMVDELLVRILEEVMDHLFSRSVSLEDVLGELVVVGRGSSRDLAAFCQESGLRPRNVRRGSSLVLRLRAVLLQAVDVCVDVNRVVLDGTAGLVLGRQSRIREVGHGRVHRGLHVGFSWPRFELFDG